APSPKLSPAPSSDFQMDPRLVGTWETKNTWPPNSASTRTARWTVQNDANFTFSGPWSDAGAITAADGKVKLFSNNATEPLDITYDFHGATLVTYCPLGDAQPTRAPSPYTTLFRSAPSPKLSPAPSFDFQLDPRLVGTWETKGRWPANSPRIRTARWTVQN